MFNLFGRLRKSAVAVTPRIDFVSIEKRASSVEGMTTVFSMEVMDAVLSFQERIGAVGNLIEFGVYKGRSAVVLSAHATASQRLILVDCQRQIEPKTLDSMFSPAEFFEGQSEHFSKQYPGFRALKSSVRFMHVDSSHFFRTTLAEMKLADQLLARDGVLCLDDYNNLHFSQIAAAMFQYLYTQRTNLTPFLITDAKAFLCRKPLFVTYASFILNHSTDEIAARGTASVLARTCIDPEYRAFYLRPKQTDNEPSHYGEHIYGFCYRTP